MPVTLRFPASFLWGAATAAHQIEGNNRHSDWWWSETHGLVPHRSGEACGSWERFDDDLALLRHVHANAYRFSIEWARVEPEAGRYDHAALDRYRGMVVAPRAAGIEPIVTLHHFTNPLWLARQGAWLSRDTAARFAGYVERMGRQLGDLVTWWVSINEPSMAATLGYLEGAWPPHRRNSLRGYFGHVRHALAGHALARQALLSSHATARVGIAFALWLLDPYQPRDPLDRAAAALLDWLWQGHQLAAAQPALDWIGVNYYSRRFVSVRHPRAAWAARAGATTDFGWEIYPRGLGRVLRRVGRYGKPVIITENGIADADDDQRARFIVSHLREAHRALGEGVDLRGYCYWSLLDNFEWAEGFSQQFGLATLDRVSLARQLRPSAAVFAEIAAANALPAHLLGGIGAS